MASSRASSLTDWLTRLETFSPHEIDLGLERVSAVLERLRLKKPDRLLHIAGTNGKGSCVELTRSLLAQSSERVGTYTSPHVLRFNERICVDGEPASDADVVAAFERVEAARHDTPLTYFEFGTLAAAAVFEFYAVDTAILEVGMGGRLDAVNAFEPNAGLITNVSLDHCDWLGRNVEAIAAEKAGIMRFGKPVIYGSIDVPGAILSAAADTGANLILAGREYDWSIATNTWSWRGAEHEFTDLELPSLLGDVQVSNAAAVLALIESLGFTKLLDAELINRAFTSIALDGRMQSIHRDRQWLLDVAHNPAAAEVLGATLRRDSHTGTTIAVVAMLDDKDVAGVIEPLADSVDAWIAVAADSERAVAVDELARQIANTTNKACLEAGSLDEAFSIAREITCVKDRVLITGSFYIVGPALNALRYTRAP